MIFATPQTNLQDMKLNLKYCPTDQVAKKRNDFLLFKTRFMTKI